MICMLLLVMLWHSYAALVMGSMLQLTSKSPRELSALSFVREETRHIFVTEWCHIPRGSFLEGLPIIKPSDIALLVKSTTF